MNSGNDPPQFGGGQQPPSAFGMPFGHHFQRPAGQPGGSGRPNKVTKARKAAGFGPMKLADFNMAHTTVQGQIEKFEQHQVKAKDRIKTPQDLKDQLQKLYKELKKDKPDYYTYVNLMADLIEIYIENEQKIKEAEAAKQKELEEQEKKEKNDKHKNTAKRPLQL